MNEKIKPNFLWHILKNGNYYFDKPENENVWNLKFLC